MRPGVWSKTARDEHPDESSAPARHPWVQAIGDRLLWWPVLAAASAIWFLFGMRLMSRFGPDALGPAAGVMLAAAVAVTLWLLSVRDSHRETLEAGFCPRCDAALTHFEETARPGALARGLQGWRCERCGFEEARPLTPTRHAS